MTIPLTGYQRKYLRGLAHAKKPVVIIGSRGFTQAIIEALDEALNQHELVKVKFNDHKAKDLKERTTVALEASTGATMVGMIGHTAIFFRPHPEPDKRKIKLYK